MSTRRIATGALLVMAAACGHSSAPPVASPSPSSSAPSSAATADGAVIAAIRESGALELFRVANRKASAQPLRTLTGPPGMKALTVTVSGGSAPTVCAVWGATAAQSLLCYDAQAGDGQAVPTGSAALLGAVGLSYSGTSLAWSARGTTAYPDLYTGHLSGGTVSAVTKVPALAPGEEPPDEVALQVGAVTWSGEDTLLVSSAFDSDPNGSLDRVPLATAPARGWTHGTSVNPPDTLRPIVGGAVSPAVGSNVLAIQRGVGESFDNHSLAVEINLASGRVSSVVSTPAKGRNMSNVSGGTLGVLYQTIGFDGDVKTYWRRPGQAHGEALAGLPSDARIVVAQA